MSLLSKVNPYWLYIKIGAALVLLAAMWGWGYHTKGLACAAAAMQTENTHLKATAALRAEWAKEAKEADEALQDALQRPPASKPIREVVDANPSRCELPAAVGDGLRREIARANKAGAAD